MKRDEWLDIAAVIAANWPHQQLPNEALAKAYHDLRDLPADQVRAAVESFYRDGERWPPTGGMVRKRVAELALDAPDFGEVWAIVVRAVGRFGLGRGGEALAWLSERQPLAGTLVRQMGWRDICMCEEPDVIRGQARRIWDALSERTTRELAYRGLPDSGLAALRRVNRAPLPLGEALPRIGDGE